MADSAAEKILFYGAEPTEGERKFRPTVFLYPKATRVIFFFVGNYETSTSVTPRLEKMANTLKCSVVCFDYPGYGKHSTYGSPSQDTVVDFMENGVRFLMQAHKWKPAQLLLMGYSLGGAIAAEVYKRLVSKEQPPLGLVLIAPFSSFQSVASRSITPLLAWIVKDKLGVCTSPLPGKSKTLMFCMTEDEVMGPSEGWQIEQFLKKQEGGEYKRIDLEGTHCAFSWDSVCEEIETYFS